MTTCVVLPRVLGDEYDDSVVDKNFGNFGESADIFQAVIIGETKVRVESRPEVVSIENHRESALLVKNSFGCIGDGGFT